MTEGTEQQPVRRSPSQKISRRPVVVGLIGLAAVEAVAGGITWKVLSQGLRKIALAFVPPVPTPSSKSPGATLYTYKSHSGGVNAVKWSPDSKRIVSGSDDQTVQVWDATTGHHALIYRGQSGGVLAVAWSPDGKHIASGGGAQIPTAAPTPTDTPTSVPTTTPTVIPTPTPLPLVFTADPFAINFTATRGQHNPTSQTLTLTNMSSTSINWSARSNSRWISTSLASGTLPPAQSQIITASVSDADLSPGIYNGFITFSALEPGSEGVFFHLVITFTLTVLPFPLIEVWEVATGITAFTYPGHKSFVQAIAWSPDDRRIASASSDKTVQVWDATTGANFFTCVGHSDAVNSVAWSPDGSRIASGSRDRTAQCWSATTGVNFFTYADHSDAVNSVVWSPDGKYIASGSRDRTVHVWEEATGRRALNYTGHAASVLAVAWSSDAMHIASAGLDKTVQVWRAI